MTLPEPARIHLLPAKTSPIIVIIRRKPSQRFHIIRWDTRSGEIEHGSWFRGKLYPMRCDVSFDGKWMIYLAMGATGKTWNGVCRLPYLRTSLEGSNLGTWFGGGFWSDSRSLRLNMWQPSQGSVPFNIEAHNAEFGGEGPGVFYRRLLRDGWQRMGDNYGVSRRITDPSNYRVECAGDDGWRKRPSPGHPHLYVRFIGYLRHGYTFRYSLEGHSDLIDERVDSACWDAPGNLIFSRCGIVHRYSFQDLKQGRPGQTLDLEPLEPPARDSESS